MQHIDMQRLSDCVEGRKARLYLDAVPGNFVFLNAPLARLVLTEAGANERDGG